MISESDHMGEWKDWPSGWASWWGCYPAVEDKHLT
jgi:hypothetical protein